MLKLCKYCKIEQPETNFETVSANNGKTYRRLECRTCKQAQQNKRRQKIYTWLVEYKKPCPVLDADLLTIVPWNFITSNQIEKILR